MGGTRPFPISYTTESASVRASVVDHSGSADFTTTMVYLCAESQFGVSVLHVSCPGNTSCSIISEDEALIGFYTAGIVSSNLALSGAEYSFELEGTLGVQDPLKW